MPPFHPMVAILVLISLGITACAGRSVPRLEILEFLTLGETIELRERGSDDPRGSPDYPPLLVLALDGVDRGLLYDMLSGGELPAMARLLGGSAPKDQTGPAANTFPHAWFSPDFEATLPSSTAVAWVTAMTGEPPAVHGVAGNEYFIRETLEFAAPVPVTIDDANPVLATYTDGYVNRLTEADGVYEKMRARDPTVHIWVAMHQYYAGADKLIVTDRNVLLDAFEAFSAYGQTRVARLLDQDKSSALFAKLDSEVIDAVLDQLSGEAPPDVLTIYVSGADQIAHISEDGPDEARRTYLIEQIDPLLDRLVDQLEQIDALADRYVLITSDHGHVQVIHDDAHSMGTGAVGEPLEVLERAGFRPRPFELALPEDSDFDTVLAYQGALAYVYVADRSTCLEPGLACDWSQPPRFDRDVLPLADAFWQNNLTGLYAPEMKGALDMVLTRQPRAYDQDDLPFEVYVGDGKLVPVLDYLAANPRPDTLHLRERLTDLAVGRYGERAGDVLLIAKNSSGIHVEDRHYFASPYRSWHGSASRGDTEIPLIVAHPRFSSSELEAQVQPVLATRAAQQKFCDVMLRLRYGISMDP